MKQFIKPAVNLIIVAALSVALLFGMSRITEAVAAHQKMEAVRKTYNGLLSASEWEELSPDGAEGITEAFRGKDKDGATIGYAVTVAVKGYGDEMKVHVALAADGLRFKGVRVGDNQESQGIGSKVAEAAYYSQFTDLPAPAYLDGYTGIDVAGSSPQEGADTAPLKNGTYRAEQENFAQGYRAFVELTITDGRIVSVNWDAYKQDSTLTKKQESENGDYIMTPDGPKWHEQAATMEAALIEAQDPAKLTYNQDDGKTDAYAGVSVDVGDFVRLAAQAMEQAKNGDNVGGQPTDKDSENGVDAVSGATVSSKAVVKAANLAYQFIAARKNA